MPETVELIPNYKVVLEFFDNVLRSALSRELREDANVEEWIENYKQTFLFVAAGEGEKMFIAKSDLRALDELLSDCHVDESEIIAESLKVLDKYMERAYSDAG